MSVFRAYDIRGIYGKDLTDEVANKIGKALGTFLKGKETVYIGWDTRLSSTSIYNSFTSGLISTGCDVISLGLVPNPVAYFHAWKNKMFGCLISASHNPKEWNGFKMINPNGVSFVEEIRKIKEIFQNQKFLLSKEKGRIEKYKNTIEDYKNFLSENLGTVGGKIVVECFGGAGTAAIKIFNSLGLEVIGLHDKPDGNFYGFERPEPKGENLNLLKKIIKKERADFGIAFDGDADRSVFIDNKGRELNGSMMNYIFIESILNKEKGTIIITSDCASELEAVVEKNGGDLIWWRVGHGFIEKKCLEEKALFAGEQSSHFYFNNFYPFSDGILATLYLAKILNENRKKLSQLVDEIKLHPTEKLYIDAKTDEIKKRVMEEVRKEFPRVIDVMDGIKIKLNDIEWILIRESQTLPEINLCIEAMNEKRLKELVEKYSKIIKMKVKV